MAKVEQVALNESQRQEILKQLENIGRSSWEAHWRESMALPEELSLENKESVIRYLLLRALLNQQGDTDKIKEFTKSLYKYFSDSILYQPESVAKNFEKLVKIFHDIGGARGSELYRVGALGGIKPLSLFLYRFASFTFFINSLDDEYLQKLIKEKLLASVQTLWEFLRDHPILAGGWVGNDPKAARMLTNWLVWLFANLWQECELSLKETLMVVDGHVGKVFSRTGFISKISYEKNRPYVIIAKDMREDIEIKVRAADVVPMFVDEGAYRVAREWCFETNPNCLACPLQPLCLAGQGSPLHKRWSAYQRFPQTTSSSVSPP
jgi:endonuclease III